MNRKTRHTDRRAGLSILETLVSLTLLIAALGLIATMAVRNHRLMAGQRAYRVAVDELTNRLEVLTALPLEAAEAEHAAMQREPLAGRLADAKIEAAFEPLDGAGRITLTLRWPGDAPRLPATTLVGWSHAAPAEEGPAE